MEERRTVCIIAPPHRPELVRLALCYKQMLEGAYHVVMPPEFAMMREEDLSAFPVHRRRANMSHAAHYLRTMGYSEARNRRIQEQQADCYLWLGMADDATMNGLLRLGNRSILIPAVQDTQEAEGMMCWNGWLRLPRALFFLHEAERAWMQEQYGLRGKACGALVVDEQTAVPGAYLYCGGFAGREDVLRRALECAGVQEDALQTDETRLAGCGIAVCGDAQTAMQAMQLGKPVLLDEGVGLNKRLALLSDAALYFAEPQEFAFALRRLQRDAALCATLAENGKQFALNAHTDRVKDRLLTLIGEVCHA